jgi:hypothetical protein
MSHNHSDSENCCPVFDPEPWDRKTLEWQEKHFVDYFFYYTTCPKCAKKHGHNYTVAFAKEG